jgi:hypothetical protein
LIQETTSMICDAVCHHWALAAIMAGILTTGEYQYRANHSGNIWAPGVCWIPIIHEIRCCKHDLCSGIWEPIPPTSTPGLTPQRTREPTYAKTHPMTWSPVQSSSRTFQYEPTPHFLVSGATRSVCLLFIYGEYYILAHRLLSYQNSRLRMNGLKPRRIRKFGSHQLYYPRHIWAMNITIMYGTQCVVRRAAAAASWARHPVLTSYES